MLLKKEGKKIEFESGIQKSNGDVNLYVQRNNVNKRRIRADKTLEWKSKRERIRNEVNKEDSLKSVSKTS